jgi:D-alanyl-D-alanine carboxypeptidase
MWSFVISVLSYAHHSERSMRTFRYPLAGVALALLAAMIACVAPASAADCGTGLRAAAVANEASYATLAWAPFGRAETGWQVYYPRVAAAVASQCAPQTPGFAAAVAMWQRAHRLQGSGILDAATFGAMNAIWQTARPFVRASRICPAPPAPSSLTFAAPRESYGGKTILLRSRVLEAYRAMVLAARKADPAIRREPRAFQIFSGFRDPAADAARCATEGNCQGVVRANCSAHRTGLAMDLWVGQAPGYPPDSSADANRLAMVATPEYRWLLANASRFGFVNYAFEPWHWEWTGEAP